MGKKIRLLFQKIKKKAQRHKIKKDPNRLFDGDDSLFKDEMRHVGLYGEYGCGQSTKWVLNHSSANVIAVDTSDEWVDKVKNNNPNTSDRLNIQYVNVGVVGG
ncbi:MAG: hypothetical protein ACON5A_05760 [Candidatus Comchoanobacterales bacterium]